jgi:hypothetical protein
VGKPVDSIRSHEPVRVNNFSLAFREMCHFVAISDTKSAAETIQRLVLQCFVILPDERFDNATQVAEALDTLFGLRVPESEVQSALDRLLATNQLTKPNNTNIVVPAKTRQALEGCIQEARALEARVKNTWLAEITANQPNLAQDDAWRSLQGYLAKAFRRHGIQATALLDPSVDADPESTRSLASLLEESVNAVFPGEHHDGASTAIYGFLASAGRDADRAAYIAQLADGAFSYFALTVSEDIAARFRAQLRPLMLLLDTNFLFGILGLSYSPFVDVSNELVEVTRQYSFPFKLRYHDVTKRELVSTFHYYSDRLKERRWSASISRAALSSDRVTGYLSGIERVYHKRNAEVGIDVDAFLAPYQHMDILLKDRGIDVYNPRADRLQDINNLFHEYEEYLKARDMDKPYDAKWHDAIILDSARHQRSRAKSSLDAGVLLLTSDTWLYRFDWETCRQHDLQPCAVLPNLLWQLLRPFIPSNPEFDRSFAETFAIPEFRTALSGAATDAARRLLSLLASYEGVHEETASKMLTNDLLLDALSKERNPKRFQERVELAFAQANAELMEEKAALAAQLEQERLAQREKEQLAVQEREQALLAQEQERAKALEAARARDEAEAGKVAEAKQHASTRENLAKAASDLDAAEKAKVEAEKRAKDAEKRAHQADLDRARVFDVLKAAGITALIMLIDLGVTYWTTWQPLDWLRNNQNSYGIQLALAVAIFCLLIGVLRREWRGAILISGVLGAILIIAQLLGGPQQSSPVKQPEPAPTPTATAAAVLSVQAQADGSSLRWLTST